MEGKGCDCELPSARLAFVRLLVILASPPTTTGHRTLSRLASLRTVVPCSSISIANLCATPARDLPALSEAASRPGAWLGARNPILQGLQECDAVMAAWGLSMLTGPARGFRSDQLHWLIEAAETHGHTEVWTVGGEARHPSRWHQYVSDVHGRTSGGPFEERLRQVVRRVSLASLTAPTTTRRRRSPADAS